MFNWVLAFLLLICKFQRSTYLDISPWFVLRAKAFSQSVTSLLILFIVSFEKLKFIFDEVKQIFSFIIYAFCVLFKRSLALAVVLSG